MKILDAFRGKPEPVAQRSEPPVVVERPTNVPHVPRRRYYAGATNSELYADFTASMLSADAEIQVALSTLRSRARNLERNVGHARRFITLMEINVVGSAGFRLLARSKDPGALREDLSQRIENAWSDFATEAITADDAMDFAELSRAVVRSWARDGEAFVQVLRGPQYAGLVAFHMIEADMVDETLNQYDVRSGREIRMGVEIDEVGKPVAYWVLNRHPGDYQFASRTWRDKYTRVPADRMIHVFVKRRPGQTRGEPPMAPAMNDIKMLSGYREAEIVHRRTAAAKMGFFERAENAGPVKGIADEVRDDGELIMEASPGRLGALPIGYKFKPFDPSATNTDYAAFERAIIRSIATGLGPNYVDLGMDLEDVSYSSIRQGVLTDRDFYRVMQSFFIFRFAMPAFRAWFDMNATLNDDLAIPPTKVVRARKACKMLGRGWSWVDPEKEIKAAQLAIEARLTSRTRVAAEMGTDFGEIVEDLRREEEIMQAAGLPEPVEKAKQPKQNEVVEKDEDTE